MVPDLKTTGGRSPVVCPAERADAMSDGRLIPWRELSVRRRSVWLALREVDNVQMTFG